MVFKKPYAFFIRYFKLINFVLSLLLGYFVYRLNVLHQTMSLIQSNNLSNYSSLKSDYIGFRMYLLIFIISIFLILIFLTLKRKNKPVKDYVFCFLYNFIVIVYLIAVSNIFLILGEGVVEQTTLKLYTDISFLIYLPIFYFIFIFALTSVGFNIKKFNFNKDILELKEDKSDNEEVEIVLAKNSYKYKRKARRSIRELKYYYLENRLIINIIGIIIIFISFSTFLSFKIFQSNSYSLNKSFVAGNFSYNVTSLYETKYDYHNDIINENYKFVIANVRVINNSIEATNIDLNKIRLIYGNNSVYANNFYNEHFIDIGTPYNYEVLSPQENNNFILIFRIPSNYKFHRYRIKFYDKMIFEKNDFGSSYKIVKSGAKVLKNKIVVDNKKIGEKVVLDNSVYGNTSITINKFDVDMKYSYKTSICDNKKNCNEMTKVVYNKENGKALLIVDNLLDIDSSKNIANYVTNSEIFFANFIEIEYNYNGKIKKFIVDKTIKVYEPNKTILSVPIELTNSSNIKIIIRLRNKSISIS